jgi:hypothetical protein
MATKGLMISERPAASVTSGAMSMGGSAYNAPGAKIGNYKGVMLCNRPFAGVATTAKASKAGPSAFLTGVPTDKIGQNPAKRSNALVNRSKKHTALSRHKKWLAELQSTKEQLEADMIADEDAKEDKKRAFMQREAQMRQAVRGMGGEDDDDFFDDDAKAEAKDGSDEKRSGGAKAARGGNQEAAEAKGGRAAPKPKAKAGGDAKPMWAMTEEAASAAAEDKEEDEAEKLLDFASSLDFDKYIDDMEVRAMMEQVKNTVDELESAIAAEDEEEEAAAEAAARAEEAGEEGEEGGAGVALTMANLARRGGDEDGESVRGGDADDDAVSVASTMLSQASSLRSIHSKKSMTALAERAKAKLGGGGGGGGGRLQPVQEEPKQPPLRVVVHNEDPMRLLKAKDPSNLPYMHRNPAV